MPTTPPPQRAETMAMSDQDRKREEIAAHVARELGFDGLAGLSPAERAAVDQQTAEAIEGCDPSLPIPADCADADREMRRLLSEYHAPQQLRADNSNVRLAEEGEVFAPEDDA